MNPLCNFRLLQKLQELPAGKQMDVQDDSIKVEVRQDCGDVFFPSSFTPNGDSRKNQFGPLGSIDLISNYKLSIYNRFGEVIFTTNNSATKWDGSYKGSKIAIASYVWYVNYTFRGVVKRSQYGTVTVIK